MSHDAYAKAQKQLSGPRNAEYQAFAKATRALMDVAETDASDIKELVEALHLNRSLWGVLAADCANPANALPEALRIQIVSLARWVSTYSREVARSKSGVDALIDVNRIMMDGLAGKAPAA